MELPGILIAIMFIVFISIRGLSVLIAAPIATIIVLLTNHIPLFQGLLGDQNSYIKNLVSFILNFFAIFSLGAILAQLMEDSGAAQSISEKILLKIGAESQFSAMIALFVISAILTYGGISVFVVLFVLVPLSRPIFRKLNISWHLSTLPIMCGAGTFTMTMLPGAPSIQNAIPIKFLGTTLASGGVIGMVGATIAIISSLAYMKIALNSSIKNNINISPDIGDSLEKVCINKPPFYLSISPLVSLIIVVLWGSFLNLGNTLIIGLFVSICIAALLLLKYLPDLQKSINVGAMNSLSPIFMTSSAVAFGNVVTSAKGFSTISDHILNIPGNPLISASLVSSIFSIITGSSSGSIGIVMSSFLTQYLEMGVNPDVFHRIVVMASVIFACMPHSGVVLTILSLCALTHKQGYYHVFMSCFVVHTLSVIGAVLTAIVFY